VLSIDLILGQTGLDACIPQHVNESFLRTLSFQIGESAVALDICGNAQTHRRADGVGRPATIVLALRVHESMLRRLEFY
jgi:hypothetical protein